MKVSFAVVDKDKNGFVFELDSYKHGIGTTLCALDNLCFVSSIKWEDNSPEESNIYTEICPHCDAEISYMYDFKDFSLLIAPTCSCNKKFLPCAFCYEHKLRTKCSFCPFTNSNLK